MHTIDRKKTPNEKYIIDNAGYKWNRADQPEGVRSSMWRHLRKGLGLASNAVDKIKCMTLKRPSREFLKALPCCFL